MTKAIAATILAITACVDVPEEPKYVYDFELETERFVIRSKGRPLAEMCGGTVAWMDQYVDSLAPYYAYSRGMSAPGVYR